MSDAPWRTSQQPGASSRAICTTHERLEGARQHLRAMPAIRSAGWLWIVRRHMLRMLENSTSIPRIKICKPRDECGPARAIHGWKRRCFHIACQEPDSLSNRGWCRRSFAARVCCCYTKEASASITLCCCVQSAQCGKAVSCPRMAQQCTSLCLRLFELVDGRWMDARRTLRTSQ